MTYNYPPEYYKQKAKEQAARDLQNGIKKTGLRVRIDRKAMLKEINKAWLQGRKVTYKIDDGDWQEF